MSDTPPIAPLAGAYDPAAPGLPRGRSRLPPDVVREQQRERLMRGAMAAVAEHGYAAVTIADIVGAARVSRKAFYEHFRDKDDCLLTASTTGIATITAHVTEAVAASRASGDDPLRAAIRAYLGLCTAEHDFARVLFVELEGVSAQARQARGVAMDMLVLVLRDARRRLGAGRRRLPEWRYLAALGAAHELIQRALIDGRTDITDLEDPIRELIGMLLELPS